MVCGHVVRRGPVLLLAVGALLLSLWGCCAFAQSTSSDAVPLSPAEHTALMSIYDELYELQPDIAQTRYPRFDENAPCVAQSLVGGVIRTLQCTNGNVVHL